MNIEDYIRWRHHRLQNTHGVDVDTPRGPCKVFTPISITDCCVPPFHIKNKDLEDTEYNLIYHGIDMSPEWKEKLYGNDDALYDAYKSLNISTLATNGKRRFSRKNIIFNKECCLCYWQLFGNQLFVISRSLDVQRAGLSDLAIVSRAAFDLGCTAFTLQVLIPHVYNNRTEIARRHNENTGI